MPRISAAHAPLLLLAAAGCNPPASGPAPSSPPAVVRSAEEGRPSIGAKASRPEVSFDDTNRDRIFADFLRDHSGAMIRKAAVGLEKRGLLRVELDRSVAPDDTLELTKSLMAGARKDFPDKPITLAVFDPNGDPILKARYKPGQGVDYQIAHEAKGPARRGTDESPSAAPPAVHQGDPLARSGVTEADRKFAAWADDHGKAYLRYVEADLEKHGRLWFGVTREVKPADVPELTKSLLEGARKEFPRGELTANVFDPDGERIGRAHLEAGGKVTWER